MYTRPREKTPVLSETSKRLALLCGLFIGAGTLGYGLIAVAAGSTFHTIAYAAIVLFLIGGVIAFVIEMPMIGVVRFAFIASFFFKGDLNLFKINEVEDPSGLNLSLSLFTAIILFLYDHYLDESQEKVFPTAFWFMFTGLFVCAAISVLNAGPVLLGGFSLLSLLTSILITYVVASHFSRRDRMIQLVVGIAVGLLFTGLVSISQYTLDFPTDLANFGTGTEDELTGTQSQLLSRVPAFLRTPTEMAWVVSSLIPIVLAPVICGVKSITSFQKMVLLAGAFAGFVAVILSLARGSWMGLVIAMVLLLLLGWYKLSSRERSEYFISGFGAIVLGIAVLSPFAGRIYDRLTEDDQGSAQIRLPLMETALRMIDDNPIVGVGLNGYRTHMTRYDETGIFVSQVFPNPVHNIFAHITAEVGIPGGLIFCLLILISLFECFKSMGTSDRLLFALAIGLAVGMIAFVISGMKEPGSLGSVRPPIRTCFFLFGTILALGRMRRRQIY